MNRLKTLVSVVVVLSLFASCGISDLEDRIEKIEEGLGYDEPIKIDFRTTDYDNQPLIEKGPYKFKGSVGTGEIQPYGDGYYYVSIDRYTNLDMDNGSLEYASISFDYDSSTNTASDISVELSFVDNYYLYFVNPEFYSDNGAEQALTLTVNSFNTETGSINIEFEGSSTPNYGGNIYEGRGMEISGSFRGKLRFVYED